MTTEGAFTTAIFQSSCDPFGQVCMWLWHVRSQMNSEAKKKTEPRGKCSEFPPDSDRGKDTIVVKMA